MPYIESKVSKFNIPRTFGRLGLGPWAAPLAARPPPPTPPPRWPTARTRSTRGMRTVVTPITSRKCSPWVGFEKKSLSYYRGRRSDSKLVLTLHSVCFNWDRLIGTISKFWDIVVCPLVCMSVCVYKMGRYQNLMVSQLRHTAKNVEYSDILGVSDSTANLIL